nr:hypothetical protein [Tanacetum cinerariifolium]
MGEPFSADRMSDFPMDELEPHPAYDFFAPGPLPGFADNQNNINGQSKADVLLLREMGEPLEVEANEPMVGLVIDNITEPMVEMEEHVIALLIDMEEDLAILFGDDNFTDDDSEGFEDDEEVSDAEVANDIAIREIGHRVFTVEGHVQVMASQMVQTMGRLEQLVNPSHVYDTYCTVHE